MPAPSFPRIIEKILVKDYYDQGYEPKEIAKEIKEAADFMNTPGKIRKAIGEFPFGDVALRRSREERIEDYERKAHRKDPHEPDWVSPARALLPVTHPLYMTPAAIERRNNPNPHGSHDSEPAV